MKLWIGLFLASSWLLQAPLPVAHSADALRYYNSAQSCNGSNRNFKCPRPKGEDFTGAAISIIQPTSLVTQTSPVIVWTGDPGEQYTVMVYRGGEVLWSQSTQGNFLKIGISLPRNAAYLVSVSSLLSGEQAATVFNVASEAE